MCWISLYATWPYSYMYTFIINTKVLTNEGVLLQMHVHMFRVYKLGSACHTHVLLHDDYEKAGSDVVQGK